MALICDNIHEAHDLDIITETREALKEGCNVCGTVIVIKKDAKGNPERRQYAEAHKKEILQPGENLYYKYHGGHLRVTR